MRRRIVEGIGMVVMAVFGAACGGEGDIRRVEEALTSNWVELKAVHSNKCMEVWGSATYDGANVQHEPPRVLRRLGCVSHAAFSEVL